MERKTAWLIPVPDSSCEGSGGLSYITGGPEEKGHKALGPILLSICLVVPTQLNSNKLMRMW